MAPDTRPRYASIADWCSHKDKIISLYQDKELCEVMEIMKQKHNFDARWVEVPNRPLAKLTAL